MKIRIVSAETFQLRVRAEAANADFVHLQFNPDTALLGFLCTDYNGKPFDKEIIVSDEDLTEFLNIEDKETTQLTEGEKASG